MIPYIYITDGLRILLVVSKSGIFLSQESCKIQGSQVEQYFLLPHLKFSPLNLSHFFAWLRGTIIGTTRVGTRVTDKLPILTIVFKLVVVFETPNQTIIFPEMENNF